MNKNQTADSSKEEKQKRHWARKSAYFLSVFFHICDTISPAKICYVYCDTKGRNHVCYLKPASPNIDELFSLSVCYSRLFFFFFPTRNQELILLQVEYSLTFGIFQYCSEQKFCLYSRNIWKWINGDNGICFTGTWSTQAVARVEQNRMQTVVSQQCLCSWNIFLRFRLCYIYHSEKYLLKYILGKPFIKLISFYY